MIKYGTKYIQNCKIPSTSRKLQPISNNSDAIILYKTLFCFLFILEINLAVLFNFLAAF